MNIRLSETLPDSACNVYNTQAEHGGIAAVMRQAQLNEPSQADTPILQMAALSYWQQHRQALLAAPFEAPQQTRARQLSQVAALADYAFTHVPFYRQLYAAAGFSLGAIQNWRDFEALPVINKRMIANLEPQAILAAGADAVASFSSRSSGSSGVPLTTFLDQNDVVRDFAEQMRFLHAATENRLQAQDWLYTLHHGGFWYSSVLGKYRVFRVMDVDDVPALAQHWQQLRPRIVTTLPSYLPMLAPLGALTRFGIEVVITNSEMSSRTERQHYSRLFGVPVLDEYSSEEIGLMATECLHGNYHAVEDGAYLEIVDADATGLGRVVVTDLGNVLMPLLRYDHGDLASWSNESCPCGQTFRCLSALHGRRDDAFKTVEGRYVPSASLLAICDDLLTDESSGMSAYRLVQQSGTQIELHYIRSTLALEVGAVLTELARRLSALFGYAIALDAHCHEALPDTSSYKRRTLLCAWQGPL